MSTVKSLKIGDNSYGIESINDPIKGNGAPTALTTANVGQIYYDVTNDEYYICSGIVDKPVLVSKNYLTGGNGSITFDSDHFIFTNASETFSYIGLGTYPTTAVKMRALVYIDGAARSYTYWNRLHLACWYNGLYGNITNLPTVFNNKWMWVQWVKDADTGVVSFYYLEDQGYDPDELPDISEWTKDPATNTGNIPADGRIGSPSSAGYYYNFLYNQSSRSNKLSLKGWSVWDADGVEYKAAEITYKGSYLWSKLQKGLTAGAGISIMTKPKLSSTLTTVGNPAISSAGDASNFSDSNYFTIANPFTASPNTYDIVFAITPTGTATDNEGILDSGNTSHIRLTVTSTNLIRLRAPGSVDITGTTTLVAGTKYWVKVSFDSTVGWTLSLSTDGTTWNTEATSTTKTKCGTGAQAYRLGDNTATGSSLNATMHLSDSYIDIGGTKTVFAEAGKDVIISNTGLQNTATGTSGLTIGGTASAASYATNVGMGSTATANGATSLGRNAKATGTDSVSIGTDTTGSGANSVAIGHIAQVTQQYTVAIGNNAKATATQGVALGRDAQVTAAWAIQLGQGTNNVANSLAVGLSSSDNYQLLNSSGKVPVDRYIPMVGATSAAAGTTGSVPAPTTADVDKFLKGDGSWGSAPDPFVIGNVTPSLSTPYPRGTRYFNSVTGETFISDLDGSYDETINYLKKGSPTITSDGIYQCPANSSNYVYMPVTPTTLSTYTYIVKVYFPETAVTSGNNVSLLGIKYTGGSGTSLQIGAKVDNGNFVNANSNIEEVVLNGHWVWLRYDTSSSMTTMNILFDDTQQYTLNTLPSLESWRKVHEYAGNNLDTYQKAYLHLGLSYSGGSANWSIDLKGVRVIVNGTTTDAYIPAVWTGTWKKLQNSIPVLESLPEEPVEGQIYFITGSS